MNYKTDPNAWFLTNAKGVADRDKNGELKNIYRKDDTTQDGYAYYVSKMGGSSYQIRTLYSSWYRYQNGKWEIFTGSSSCFIPWCICFPGERTARIIKRPILPIVRKKRSGRPPKANPR